MTDCCSAMDRENERLETELDSHGRAIAGAIDELRRWQYSDDIEQIRHSVDAAIAILQRA